MTESSSGAEKRVHDFALSPKDFARPPKTELTGEALEVAIERAIRENELDDDEKVSEFDISKIQLTAAPGTIGHTAVKESAILSTPAGYLVGAIGVLIGGIAKLASLAIFAAGAIASAAVGCTTALLSIATGLPLLAALLRGLYSALWEKKSAGEVLEDILAAMRHAVQYPAVGVALIVAGCFAAPLIITSGIEKAASKLYEIPGWRDINTPATIMGSIDEFLTSQDLEL